MVKMWRKTNKQKAINKTVRHLNEEAKDMTDLKEVYM